MGYYMRFVVTDDRKITLPEIADALRGIDVSYSLSIDDGAARPSADLIFGGDLYAELEINTSGDGLFEDELAEFKEFAEDAGAGDKTRVLNVLESAKSILAVRVLFGERDVEVTMENLDPLWEWLFANRDGLLQADGEGYYDASGLVLETE